ncbi:hypothetical protein [Microvirga tunisiensis]|uniref:Uncharacterized protein n=1 Tax=Microvirga tunisiensis TaxID=2108360 RepID=A0A5N7MX26_9HYPH|nr:hypothetical protein [Microvirga tunisiensis]MPR13662.1 hypothetical protein [Microvirga tunisiensis]MPR31507.1 hypothetical protein [Microvirga tunisiensis]
MVNRAGAVLVGNISSTWQIASGAAKATHDVSWSMLRNFLKYIAITLELPSQR